MTKNPLQLPYRIILGSQSPRRQELLKGLDIPFEVRVKPTDEHFAPDMPVAQVPEFLARNKAAEFAPELESDEKLLIITADTIVAIEGKILNKPADREEAIQMLTALSGKRHTVITGVCLKTQQQEHCFATHTEVYFKPLDAVEIAYYLDHYKPYDKAGSYGVQEWIGYVCIDRIEGSYFNVMGLPVHELYAALRKFS